MVRLFTLLLRALPFAGAALIAAAVIGSIQNQQMSQGTLVLMGMGFALLLAMFLKFEAASLRYYLNFAILAVLVFGNAAILYLLSRNHPVQWDLTRGARYSLSPQTQRILGNLKKNVAVTVWSTQNEPCASYLERYAALSGHFTYSVRNPLQKSRASENKPGEKVEMNSIEVQCGDNKEVISMSEMSRDEMERMSQNLERHLMNAILSVVRDHKFRLYFVTGHGEKIMQSLTGDQGEARSIWNFGLLLHKSGMDVRAGLDLKSERLVPEDCDLLVLAGPQLDYTQGEIEAIRAYLDKGGRLLVLVDPPLHDRMRRPLLCGLLKDYGIQVSEDILVDYGGYAVEQNDYFTLLVRNFSAASPITESLVAAGESLPLTLTCAVQPRPDAAGDLAVSELMHSSEQSWEISLAVYQMAVQAGKLTFPPKSQWRTHSLAVAAEPRATAGGIPHKLHPRIVVVGDSDFLVNARLSGMQGQLGYSMVAWLTGQTNSVEIPPRDAAVTYISLNAQQRNLVLILSVVVIPFAVFFGGLSYTTVRRRRR